MAFALSELSKSPWLINGICPYFTMFPLQYPVQILNNTEHATVLDPFCGRGTSLFAARMFGFSAYGIDSNPVAIAISKAKLSNATIESIMDTLNMALNYHGEYVVPESEFWKAAYNDRVLNQICKVRSYLLIHDGSEECALRGLVLGALHGPKAKSLDKSSYLGNQMPRTYAPKPGYSVRYWSKNNLVPDYINIESVIKRRASRFYGNEMPNIPHEIIYGDARENGNYHTLPLISTVITSPPYYGMRTYYTDQWIRNWFLGGPDAPVNALNNQIDHSSPEDFALALSAVWRNCASVSQQGARMYVRYGGISSRKTSAMEIFEQSIALTGGLWRILNINDAGNALAGKRQAVQMLINTDKESIPTSEFDVELILNA